MDCDYSEVIFVRGAYGWATSTAGNSPSGEYALDERAYVAPLWCHPFMGVDNTPDLISATPSAAQATFKLFKPRVHLWARLRKFAEVTADLCICWLVPLGHSTFSGIVGE